MPRTISCVDLALNLAAQGKRVLWVDHSREIAEIVRSLDRTDERFEAVYASNGRERVLTRNDGEVRFVAARGKGYRGVQADVLFVTLEAYEDKRLLTSILPALNASKHVHADGEPHVIVLPGRPRINV